MQKVIVPTLNAAAEWPHFASALLEAVPSGNVLILDSSSTDATPALAHASGFEFHTLARAEFNHGGTRQLGVNLCRDSDLIVFLTQDAVVAGHDSVERLLRVFDDPMVAAAYGRQLPKPGAHAIEAHARLFNYPDVPDVRDLASKDRLGIKAVFLSNSFAAYRRSALTSIGGFPSTVIFGEDTVTAARLLLGGWKIAYAADACVYHSHAYSFGMEFRRYFDVGVLHRRERWLLEKFGEAGGEGKRFVKSEVSYLWKNEPMQIPSALIRTGLKLLGYRLGRMEEWLLPAIKRRLSLHRSFWNAPAAAAGGPGERR